MLLVIESVDKVSMQEFANALSNHQVVNAVGLMGSFILDEWYRKDNGEIGDRGLADSLNAVGTDEATVSMATHYVKCFACRIDENNPRVRDLDCIVRLCERRHWQPVFLILPDNEEQIDEMVGHGLVELLHRNAAFMSVSFW